MARMTAPEVIIARRALLDALDALGPHRDAVILVGAQAIYLHTGSADVALAEFTTDADLAIDPSALAADPLIDVAMTAAGFVPDPDTTALGTWRSRDWVPVDLLVPDAVAGAGRRSADVPPHDKRAMRRAVGLEPVLLDNVERQVESFDPEDARTFSVRVAGPAALLIAKAHKVAERIDTPKRLDAKDAHDIYRLLRAVSTDVLVDTITRLTADPIAGVVTRSGVQHLATLFAAGEGAPGSVLAGQAEEHIGDPAQVALAASLLAEDLVLSLAGPMSRP